MSEIAAGLLSSSVWSMLGQSALQAGHSTLKYISAGLGTPRTWNVFTNIIGITYTVCKHYILNQGIKPSCVIGGIPLPHVQELSGAISDRILKYRARGGLFLAHQDGGQQSLRVIGKSYGPNRFIFLDVLHGLFMYGSSQQIDMVSEGKKEVTEKLELLKDRRELTVDPWKVFHDNAFNENAYEYHRTFPVVTKQRIHWSMYIETYQYVEKIEEGQECVEYTIFFREVDTAPKYDYARVPDPKQAGKYVWYYKEVEMTWFWRIFMNSLTPILTSIWMSLLRKGLEQEPTKICYMFALEHQMGNKGVLESIGFMDDKKTTIGNFADEGE